MNQGLSNQVRAVAQTKYVEPAIRSGKREFSIPVKDLREHLKAEGFPGRHTPQICSALQTAKFLRENGLEIEKVIGPPSRMSSTVVVRYRVADSPIRVGVGKTQEAAEQMKKDEEDPAARSIRLTEELAAAGGGEAFLRWVRSEDEDAA
jgi:hypothetical protein